MLNDSDNTTLTVTKSGSPMGRYLRRYWIPILLDIEVPHEGWSRPVRVGVMGEQLIAFRSSDGQVGLLDEFCAHRRASLFYGRNEGDGLRCSYHGWKYDCAGQCIEMPSEPEVSRFKEKIQLKSYSTVDVGGVIWAYMGPKDRQPLPPELEWMRVPASHRFVSKRIQQSNWMQAMEGGIDSSHISFLHRAELLGQADDPTHSGSSGSSAAAFDTRPKFEVVTTDYGALIGARRDADDDHYYWRITQWIMPWFTMIPPTGGEPLLNGHAWVPIDDQTCMAWSITWHPARALTSDEREQLASGKGIHTELMPGSFHPVGSLENDFLLDPELQRTGRSYSGIPGVAMQDAAMQESMGRIVDRSLERLGTSDAAIIMARQRLLEQARLSSDEERGPQTKDLPALDPATHRVRSAAVVLPRDVPFHEGAAEALVSDLSKPFAYV